MPLLCRKLFSQRFPVLIFISRVTLCSFFLLFLAAQPVGAIIPYFSDDAAVQLPGHFFIESGFLFDKSRDNASDTSYLWTITSYGITEQFTAAVNIPYFFSPANGLGDLILSGKYKFLDESDAWPAFSVRGDLSLANSDAAGGLGNGFPQYVLHGIFSKQVTNNFYWSTDLGYLFSDIAAGENAISSYLFGFYVWYNINEQTALVSEISGSYSQPSPDKTLYFLLGANWQITKIWGIDAFVNFGLTEASSKYIINLGLNFQL